MSDERKEEILYKCLDYIESLATSEDNLYETLFDKIGLSDEEIKEFDINCIPEEEEEEEEDEDGYSLYEEERREYYRNVELPQISGMNRR